MYPEEQNLKAQAQRAYEDSRGANMCCDQATTYRPPTLREEAEKLVGYHREQADKADIAAAFFRTNPPFDEFITLVRKGVIHF